MTMKTGRRTGAAWALTAMWVCVGLIVLLQTVLA